MPSTKDSILKWKLEIDQAKKTDYKELLDRKETISKEITTLFQRIQKKDYQDIEEFNQLGIKIDHLNLESKVLEKKYQKEMKSRFKELSKRYPSIYDIFVNGKIDPLTLKNVLSTFDQMERGYISSGQGLNRGLDYMTNKYNLPNDFFNREAKE